MSIACIFSGWIDKAPATDPLETCKKFQIISRIQLLKMNLVSQSDMQNMEPVTQQPPPPQTQL